MPATINPDGLAIEVDLHCMKKEQSIFVACLDVWEAVEQVRYLSAQEKVPVVVQPEVYKGILGVRIWRTP